MLARIRGEDVIFALDSRREAIAGGGYEGTLLRLEENLDMMCGWLLEF